MAKSKRRYTLPPKRQVLRLKRPKTGKPQVGSGKPKGAKDHGGKGSRTIKASVKAIIEEVVRDPKGRMTIEKALIDGLKGGPRNADRYLRLCADYMDGKPVDTMNLNAQVTMDEVTTAKTRLEGKLNTLLKAVLAKRKVEAPTP